jgi:hypothetical protein
MIQVKMAWLDQGLFASERERVLDGCGLKGIETTLWGLGILALGKKRALDGSDLIESESAGCCQCELEWSVEPVLVDFDLTGPDRTGCCPFVPGW